jgi:hypothetical protein
MMVGMAFTPFELSLRQASVVEAPRMVERDLTKSAQRRVIDG